MEITPTPIIYVEDIRLNDLSVNGAVFSISSDGVYTPEVGAFVYVYINDVLVNEQVDPYNLTGVATRTGYVTTTRIDGTWVCPVQSLRAGLKLTAIAHAVGKSISEPSTPYRVGSLPMPVDIHEVNQFGQNDTLKHGHYTIEGYFEGLHNRKYNRITDPESSYYAFPYEYNFDLCPYIDGIKQERLPYNEVWGKNFLAQVVDVDWDECFTILVQSVPKSICLNNIVNSIYNEVLTYPDLIGTDRLVIHPPNSAVNTVIHVYRNGRRLAEGISSDYTLQLIGGQYSVVFNTASFAPDPDDIYMFDYLVVTPDAFNYYRTLVVTNSSSTVFGVNKGVGLQVFRDGLRLLETVDYSVETAFSDRFVTLFEPLTTDEVLLLSYFDLATTPYRIDTTTNVISSVEVNSSETEAIRSTIRVFKAGLSSLPQMIMLYKNGLRLAFGADFDYIKAYGNATYTEYQLSSLNQFSYEMVVGIDGVLRPVVQDNVVVELMYSGVPISKVQNELNKLPSFVENKLFADVVESGFLRISSPYTLEFIDGDTSYFKTFGKGPSLVPGKDGNGNFKNYIDFKGNNWRYTFSKPLRRLQSVTAATFIRSN